jgi:hypothetical protein
MEDVGTFYEQLVYFTTIWYILWPLDIFFPVLVSCTKKNLATLLELRSFGLAWKQTLSTTD